MRDAALGQVNYKVDGRGKWSGDLLPERPRRRSGRWSGPKVADSARDIGATAPANSGRLVSAKLRFHLRPQCGSKVRAKESSEAGGQLERSHAGGLLSARELQ